METNNEFDKAIEKQLEKVKEAQNKYKEEVKTLRELKEISKKIKEM